ncbi:DUF3990 domain-containing protein [Bacteroides sp. 519]|uniref:DUF3990 domain-containing protein n=1 Tax=Bacteroides sp. 519 TaxID=2302937 RepID=UPI0013D73F67|nr:DUF3990 domain-containing protein [Bacteroides sp. 519]NDV57730.1 DUF3990 domain-containing protein [Bacteroides sp. 519]
MRVYHGSYVKVDKIDLSKCKPNKDFGKGFYVTKFRKHAEEWAKVIGEKHGTDGYVTEFEFSENDFTKSICNIKRFDTYSEEWLDFVVSNRDKNNEGFNHNYDIIIGPVADDKVQNTLRLYLKGKIAKEKFLKMLTYHDETHQICFCTLNSLQTIDRIDDTPTYEIVMISEPIIEKLVIDFNLDGDKAANLFFDSDTYNKLCDPETKLYQKSWTETFKLLLAELDL